jgi:hypothetical protein
VDEVFMRFRNLNVYDMLDAAKEKTFICFGAGNQLINASEAFSDISFFERIDFITDNDKNKYSFSFNEIEKPVYSIEHCLKNAKNEPVILITMLDCSDVIEQLNSIQELKNCDGFVYVFIRDLPKSYRLPKNRALHEPLKIPKTIHYCWFGGTPIPSDFAVYIESWKKFCPDYEIVRWDESNYDYKQNEYMYEAYKHKKWGFVPDYARLDIIHKYGGVYLDTDVELIKNIDDLLCDEAFCGFESRLNVSNGLGFGAIAGFPLIMELLEIYDKVSFLNKDGSLNLTPSPKYHTELLVSKGLELNNTLQELNGMAIYPTDVLSPLSFSSGKLDITDNTYAIHHYAGTWLDNIQREKYEKRIQKYQEILQQINAEG